MNHLDRSQPSTRQELVGDLMARLEDYERMERERKRYVSLQENAEKQRNTVQPHIFEKVKQEYARKIAILDEELRNKKVRMQEELQGLARKRADLQQRCRHHEDRLEEIEFRIRIGEFSEQERAKEREEIKKQAAEEAKELARLEEILSRSVEVGLIDNKAPGSGREKKAGGQEDHAGVDGKAAEDPVPASEPCAGTQDFEIVEEGPALGGEEDAPVVHCPAGLSANGSTRGGASEGRGGQTRPPGAPDMYVTGYLVALEGSRKGQRFPMISSNITLGNSPGMDIRLSDPGIANFHARILYKDRKHYLENLDNMGRSFVNGIQAADIVELKDGDVVRLGDIKMQVEYASATKPRAA